MKQRIWQRALPLILATILALFLFPTVLASGGPATTSEPTLSVSVAPAQLEVEVGKSGTVEIYYTLINQDGSFVDLSGAAVACDWSLSDQNIASYASEGIVATVSGVAVGSTTLSGTVRILLGAEQYTGNVTSTITVKDTIAVPTKLSLNTGFVKLDRGLSQQLLPIIEPAGASGTLTWTSEKPTVAEVDANGKVTAMAPGETVITAKLGVLQATCRVIVSGIVLDRSAITLLQNENTTLIATGYGDAGTSISWTSSKATVASVSGGRVAGVSAGTATITVSSATGSHYDTSASVTVRDSTVGVITGTASTANPLRFGDEIANQIDQQCRNLMGVNLQRIQSVALDVPSTGTLYYGYVSESSPGLGVASGKSYYYNQTNGEMLLSGIAFVPKADFSGTSTITYTGYGIDGRAFQGTIRVTVERVGDVVYSVNAQQPVTFDANHFSEVCRSRKGVELSYVTFTLPSSTKGVLYYNYSGSTSYDSKVSSTEKYYRAQASYLSRVTFIPAQDATGSISLTYNAHDINGGSYSGRVTVNVAGSGGKGDLDYSVSRGSYVRFSASEFNTLSQSITGKNLSYVKFDLPSSRYGTLYYEYRSNGNYDSKVSSSTKYNRSGGSYSLGNVSFAAASDASGSVGISFTGWNVDGDTFQGTVGITIKGEGSGNISYRTSKNTPVTFDADDFNTVSKEHNDYNFKYITFSLPSSSKGKLYYNYRSSGNYDSSTSSTTRYYRNESPYLKNVTFVPASGYSGTVEISFAGYDTNDNRLSGTVSIQVGGSSSSDGDLSYSVAKNGSVTLDIDDFNSASKDYNGYNLRRVTFTPPSSSRGALYYNYTSSGNYEHKITDSGYYYRSESPYLNKVSFVPAKDYTGTVSIAFTAWDTENTRFTGEVSIRVDGSGGTVSAISYTVQQNGTVFFDDSHFNTASKEYNGKALESVKFTLPASNKGTLYYTTASTTGTGSKVSTSTSYLRNGSPYLNRVNFVPASGVTGTVSIGYTGYDSDGGRFTGTVSIRIGGGVSGSEIRYSTKKNTTVEFRVEDFNDASRNQSGYNLDYVTFELPSSSKGTLYYKESSSSGTGTRATASTQYRRNSSPYLERITFAPASGYIGSVDIKYTAWDAGAGRFTGVVTIQVGNGTFDGLVSYKTTSGRPVTFDVDAFNIMSKAYDGNNIQTIKFTQPLSSVGTLYHGYGGNKETKISSSTTYYRTSTPYLYEVTFAPASGFTGKAEVPFTATDTNGQKLEGKVVIQVEQPVAQPIRYTVIDGVARLKAADFSAACLALMNEDVVKIILTPPAATFGQIYYGYEGTNQYGGLVSTATELYYDRTPNLSAVAFVPKASFAGAAIIPYAGEDANGYSFAGTVEIAVPAGPTVPQVPTNPETPTKSRFTDMEAHAWAVPAVEYLYRAGVVNGTSDSTYSPKGPTSRGDYALMIVRAFHLSTATNGERFSDVPADKYYAEAIATARTLGIALGADGIFRPNYPVNRQDAMVMLQRAMRAAGHVVTDGTAADLTTFVDAGTVTGYAIPAVASMVKLGVVQGDEAKLLNPASYITRAEMAVILHRALTAAI